jgi:MFS family permease
MIATVEPSTFTLRMGIALLFLSPLSEVPALSASIFLLLTLAKFYGRRPIYIISLSFSVIWLIVCAVAKNIQTLIIARLLGRLQEPHSLVQMREICLSTGSSNFR